MPARKSSSVAASPARAGKTVGDSIAAVMGASMHPSVSAVRTTIPATVEALAAMIPARIGDAAAVVQARVDAIALAVEVISLPVMTVAGGVRGPAIQSRVD